MHKLKALMMFVWITGYCNCQPCDAFEICDSDPSAVVTPGTKVNVSCWCLGSSTSLVINASFLYSPSQPLAQEILDARGITVMPYSLDVSSGFSISTNATALSNNTFFDCSSSNGISPRVYIYVVYGPPSPPKVPNLSAINSTTLIISWTAPWSLPVDNYTISMLHFDTADVQNIWTTLQTSFPVTKPQNSDCELFDFIVEANTGVGSSGPSQPSTAGFLSSPEAYEIEFLVKNVFVNNDKLVIINIYIEKASSICSYEMIEYRIDINNTNNFRSSVENVTISNTDTLLVVNSTELDASPGDVLQLIFMVFNIDSQEFQTYAYSNNVVIQEETPTNNNYTDESVPPSTAGTGSMAEFSLLAVAGVVIGLAVEV